MSTKIEKNYSKKKNKKNCRLPKLFLGNPSALAIEGICWHLLGPEFRTCTENPFSLVVMISLIILRYERSAID